jgi:hypothetical protein
MLREAQKALRRTGVGASECAAPLGLSPYTRIELDQIRCGEEREISKNLTTRFGLAPSHQPRSIPARPVA